MIMHTILFETPRLLIVAPDVTDKKNWCDLFAMPTVMHYATQGWQVPNIELQTSMAHIQEKGFGIGSVIEKKSKNFIGISGLYLLEEPPYQIATATLLYPVYWHQGYGLELKNAHFAWGFTQLGVDSLCAVVHPDNSASRHVLEKSGMHLYKKDHYFNSNILFEYYIFYRREFEKENNERNR